MDKMLGNVFYKGGLFGALIVGLATHALSKFLFDKDLEDLKSSSLELSSEMTKLEESAAMKIALQEKLSDVVKELLEWEQEQGNLDKSEFFDDVMSTRNP